MPNEILARIIIVEDEPGRIRNMLDAISRTNEMPFTIRNAAQIILAAGLSKTEEGREIGFNATLAVQASCNSSYVIIIYPENDTDFKSIEKKLSSCEHYGCICFLDLRLNNAYLDNTAGRNHGILSAGVYIGEKFGRQFGRLLVQASGIAPGEGYAPPNDTDYCGSIVAWPETLAGATMLVNAALTEYERRYCCHALPEIARLLALICRARIENWDNGWPLFYHDFLGNAKSLHYVALCSHLELDVKDNDHGNSFKGLFQLAPIVEGDRIKSARGTEKRPVKKAILTSLLDKISMKVSLSASVGNWYFPIKPALPFLLALREFWSACDTPKPKFSLDQSSDGVTATGRLVVEFSELCNLRNRYDAKVKTNNLSGTSRALDNLLKAHTDVKSTEDWAALFKGQNYIATHIWSENDKKLTLEWSVS